MQDEDDKSKVVAEEEVVEDEQLDQDDANEEVQDGEDQQDEDVEQDDDQQDEQSEEDVEQQLSRRAAKRAGQLKFQELLRQQAPQRQAPNRNQSIDYESMIDADPEVYEQLRKASEQFGTQQYLDGVKEADKVRFETRLEVDAPRVESKYPQLDPKSDEFNPAVADSINRMYLSAVGYDEKSGYVQNPNLRYAPYVEAFFELVDEATSRQVETTRRNVTKQVARTGIRPDGSSTKKLDLNKPASEMSDDELAAKLKSFGLAPPKKR